MFFEIPAVRVPKVVVTLAYLSASSVCVCYCGGVIHSRFTFFVWTSYGVQFVIWSVPSAFIGLCIVSERKLWFRAEWKRAGESQYWQGRASTRQWKVGKSCPMKDTANAFKLCDSFLRSLNRCPPTFLVELQYKVLRFFFFFLKSSLSLSSALLTLRARPKKPEPLNTSLYLLLCTWKCLTQFLIIVWRCLKF